MFGAESSSGRQLRFGGDGVPVRDDDGPARRPLVAAAGRLASAASAQVVSQFGPRLEAEQHAPLKDVL